MGLGFKFKLLQKVISIILAVLLTLSLVLIIWKYMDINFEETQAEILSNPIYTKGVITTKRSYKGKGVDVAYLIGGKKYLLTTGVKTEFYKQYEVGDTVEIVYSKKNPNVVLLKHDLND